MSDRTRHHDLVIIGSGSGNSIPGPEFDDLDIAIVEHGKFGGTCLNVGCVPTKMFVHPADLAVGARAGAALGVTMSVDAVDWPAIRDRVFGRIDPLVDAGEAYRRGPECPNVTVYGGTGRFVGFKRLDTGTGTDRHRRPLGRCRWQPGHGSRRRGSASRAPSPHVRHDHAPRRATAVGDRLRRRVHRRRVRPRVRCLRLRGDPGDPWRSTARRP